MSVSGKPLCSSERARLIARSECRLVNPRSEWSRMAMCGAPVAAVPRERPSLESDQVSACLTEATMTEQPTSASRRSVLAGAVGLTLAAGLPASAQTRAMKKPSIVFVHGIWADGSSFHKVVGPLRAEGHEVICAQYGLDTLKGDVDAVIHTI